MSKSLTVLLLILLISLHPALLRTHLQAQQLHYTDAAAADSTIQQLVDKVSKDSILSYVRQLERFGTRFESTPQRDSAATYIVNKLKSWGYAAGSDLFSYSATDFSVLDVVDQNTVWVAGQDTRDQHNVLLHTPDAGKTWISQNPPGLAGVRAIDFVSITTGWLVGSAGAIFKTSDGGATWREQELETAARLVDIGFANAKLGIAVGYGGVVLRTNDGSTWREANTPDTISLVHCKVIGPRQMWAVGNAGAILFSSDSGATWSKQNSGVSIDLSSVDFADSVRGWVTGSMATVLKTSDGGRSWIRVSLPPEARRDPDESKARLCVLDTMSALVVTAGEIWKTTDAGVTWKRAANVDSRSLSKIGARNLLTCGGTAGILQSTDAGGIWESWDQNVPRSLYTASRNCYASVQGSLSPEKEYLIVAHYDSPAGNVPGADDNASGVAAALEVMRILKDMNSESTVKFVTTSGEEVGLLGSRHYANLAVSQGETIVLAINLDMLGYPVTGDTTRLVIGSYERRSGFVDSALSCSQRYGIGSKIDPRIDSTGWGDSYSFDVAGYEMVNLSEGTPDEIAQGNPYVFKPTDTSEKLDQGMLRRTAQLCISMVAGLAKVSTPPRQPWAWSIPYDRWSDLKAITVVDANIAFAVGDFGTILKTTDGGLTWNRQKSVTLASLRGVSFADANRGVAVGDLGTILRTTDGGTTWNIQQMSTTIAFYGACLYDTRNGFAVGGNGAMYQTSNGGVNWVPKVFTPGITIYGISFVNKSIGFIFGEFGAIFRTTDGGTSWLRQVSGIESYSAPALLGMAFLDTQTGVAVGEYGTLIRTTNGGANWTPLTPVSNIHVRSLRFRDSNNGFAVGDGGLILTTSDGGLTWRERKIGISTSFAGIQFASANTGYIVGTDGMLVRTTDGGETWTYQIGGPRIPLYGIRFTTPTNGIAVGYQGGIYRTTDGGITWGAKASGTTQHLRGVDFPDQSTGIAVGEFGALIRTTDGGATWTDQTIQPSITSTIFLNGVAFGTPSKGVAVGRLDSLVGTAMLTRSLILRTADGGKNWVRVASPKPNDRELRGVSFGSATVVTAVGDSGLVLRSTDSGVSWFVQAGITNLEAGITPPTQFRLNAVSCGGPSVGIAVGEWGTLLRTTDAGVTWKAAPTGTNARFTGVWTPNGTKALVVGSAGTVLMSSDSGASWEVQQVETNLDLYAVHFLDADRGTIVGDRGVVLRTALASTPTIVPTYDRPGALREFDLAQNYPNPFNGATTIGFRLSNSQLVTIKIYDILGREVVTLVNEVKATGEYRIVWNSAFLPSGVYFCCLHAGSSLVTKRMVLLK